MIRYCEIESLNKILICFTRDRHEHLAHHSIHPPSSLKDLDTPHTIRVCLVSSKRLLQCESCVVWNNHNPSRPKSFLPPLSVNLLLRSTFCGQCLVLIHRTLAWRSTFAGRLTMKPRWNHQSRQSIFSLEEQ